MRLLLGVLLVASMFGCQSSSQSKTSGVPFASLSYAELQKKAESFTPSIGKRGGEIILSSFSDPKSFNPITSTETSTSEFTSYMYEGLMRTDGVTLLPKPGLAQSYEVSDDGLIWTFHIRKGTRWSDSVPFSAYDVTFTFNDLIYNDKINPNSSRDIFLINNKKIDVVALDSFTVRFTLPTQYVPFLRALSQEILPRHTCEKFVKDGSFTNALGLKTPPSEMVGTGPFMLSSYVSGQKVVFERNPLYWQKDSAGTSLPYLDRVVYLVVQDQNVELLRFKSREIDYLGARGEDYPSLKKEEATGNYTVFRLGPTAGSSFLALNQNTGTDAKTGKPYVSLVKQGWFRNTLFRKALAYAMDRENMIAIVMNGLGYPQWGPMSPSEGFFFDSTVSRYPYNLDSSRALLARAGFRDSNNDSILEDAQGNPVEFSFVTNAGNTVRIKLAEMIRKDLERIGCKVHFQQIEFNSLIQKIDNPPYAWDALLMGLTGGPEPHFGRNVWHSSGSLHMWFPDQATPSTPWEATIDSIYDAGVKEIDITKRKALYSRWQAIAADELPFIYTVLTEKILCISNRVHNLNPCPNGGLLHNLEYLYVTADN